MTSFSRIVSVVLILCGSLLAQGSFSQVLTITNSTGNPIAGATVTTFSNSTCTTPIVTYSNLALNTPPGGQSTITTDGNGNFSFYGTAGFYYYSVSGSGTNSATCFPVMLPITTGTSAFVNIVTSNVNHFYYVDGTTYTTIQSAITAACAASPVGGTVYIPPGTYQQSGAFTLCSGINIIGSGRNIGDSVTCPTTITTNQTTGDLFSVTNLVNVHVSDLCIKDIAAAGANAAIRLNYGAFTVWERLYISGPFAVAIELDSSSTSAGSTIRNTFRDIFDTGLANNGIGCLLNSSDASSKVINNNIFDMVACQGGATGASAAGIKLTNSGVHNQVINENRFTCDEVGTLNGGGGGTGILIDQGSTADTTFIDCNVENNVTGLNKATSNSIQFLGGNISSNGTNVTDAQPTFTLFFGTRVGGVTPDFSIDPTGDVRTNSLCVKAACDPGNFNMLTGAAYEASGTTFMTGTNTGPVFPKPAQLTEVAFSALPACNGGNAGKMAAVNDSNTAVWGATIAGSSTNHVLAYCDAANWTVAGK